MKNEPLTREANIDIRQTNLQARQLHVRSQSWLYKFYIVYKVYITRPAEAVLHYTIYYSIALTQITFAYIVIIK